MDSSTAMPLLSPSTALARLRRSLSGTQNAARPAADMPAYEERYGLQLTAGLGLLIPKRYPRELLEGADICPLPYGPAWLLGLINVRGLITPVLDLTAFWGLPPSPEPASRLSCLLLLGQGRDAFALPLHQLPHKVRLPADSRLSQPPPLPERLQACVSNVHRQEGLWCEWAMEPFLRQMTE